VYAGVADDSGDGAGAGVVVAVAFDNGAASAAGAAFAHEAVSARTAVPSTRATRGRVLPQPSISSTIGSNIDHHRLLQVVYSDARAAPGFHEIEISDPECPFKALRF
jgi:hypothetical protein